jgi:RNA polymerase sigma-70 factor (ECF subfamily)
MDSSKKISVNIHTAVASNAIEDTNDATMDDRLLVERCQQGELEAFEGLVARYRNRVFGLAYGMLRNEADATDVAQETFIRAWQGIRKFKNDSAFYTWLYRITTNLCIDYVRRRNRRPTGEFQEEIKSEVEPSVGTPPSNNPSPRAEIQNRELGAQIDAALAQLSPEHRAVVQLREFEGLDYSEIARAVGCSIGTVMSRLFYARKHLQKLLKEAQ